MIARKGFPTRIVRYCCEELKEYKTPGFEKCIIGVRKSESRARAERYKEPTQCMGSKAMPYEAIYPLLDWTDDDVLQFIIDRKIQLAPRYYDENGNIDITRRLGCIGCPLIYKTKRIAQFKKYPRMVKAWLKAGQKFRDTHPQSVRVVQNDDVYEWFVRELFYNNTADFEAQRNGFFGKPDYKAFLEEQFNINLDL